MVFTTDINLFDDNYIENSSLARNEYSTYNVTGDLSKYAEMGNSPSLLDYAAMAIFWLWEALIMFIKIIFSIVFIYPVLVNVFKVPAPLSAMLQTSIYILYIWGLVQFKSGRGTKHYT